MSSKKRFKSWLVFTVCLALAVSVLSGCQSAGNSRESGPSSAPEQSSFKAGTYTGEAEGKDGTVKVEVTMEEPDQIKDIQIVSQTETEGLGDAALEKIKEQILQNQTLAVDAVSGASKSSEAMLTAVEKAVQQAGGDLTAMKSGGVAKAG
ncbi:FMN-binding protein, partial [Paenibacillus macerans]|uniref:FMN-binding protein n=1 Tax=Paenibacillus macerans TaxID=44252 RepID=UPI002E240213